ncbi:hypothetical protein [Dactylosporangium sp. NPDC049140]|uniref:hypothetical protein n=1 Tax=Dactylosporangium sp. NPDC049140 TaxID=3155647 RepID=UPI003403AF67
MRHTGETIHNVLAEVPASTRPRTRADPAPLVVLPAYDDQPAATGRTAYDLMARLPAAIERRDQAPVEVTPGLLAAIQQPGASTARPARSCNVLSARAKATGDDRSRDQRFADHGEHA